MSLNLYFKTLIPTTVVWIVALAFNTKCRPRSHKNKHLTLIQKNNVIYGIQHCVFLCSLKINLNISKKTLNQAKTKKQ